MSATTVKPSIYELKITLLGIEPAIWRRIQVPGTLHLWRLHSVIDVVMGWQGNDLYYFQRQVSSRSWLPVQLDESRKSVRQVLKSIGDSMIYVYDLGDGWQHEILLENILPFEIRTKPVCLGGERHCPPEDVGGPKATRTS